MVNFCVNINFNYYRLQHGAARLNSTATSKYIKQFEPFALAGHPQRAKRVKHSI